MKSTNLDLNTQQTTIDNSSPAIYVLWDKATQQAVINNFPGSKVTSRAYK